VWSSLMLWMRCRDRCFVSVDC